MASLAMLMPEAEQTASHDMLKPEAKETAFQALFKPDADKKASQNLITLKPNKMASYTMLLSKADDVAYQALLKPESNEMAYQVLNMCEAEEVHPTPCSSQRLPRWPPKTSSLLRPTTQPFKPGFHLILLTIMSKPSHLTPSSLLSTHLLLPASMPHVRFWAPLPHQVHTKDITCLRALDLVWTFCLGGRTAGERSARYPPSR